MIWLLVLLLFLPAGGPTQAPRKKTTVKPEVSVAGPVRWPLEILNVEGNKNYTKEQILAVAGLKTGLPAGKADFDAARERLIAAGVFETVGYRFQPAPAGKGYVLTFEVAEIAQVFPWRFDRLDVPDKELEEALRRSDPLFGAKIAANETVLNRYAKVIETYLAGRNRNGKVVARIAADEPERLVVVFSPATPPPPVAAVNFVNNSAVSVEALRSAVAGAAIGSAYSEPRFRQILDSSVRPLYEALGRLRVSFPRIQTEQAQDIKGLLVTVEVSEGEVYELREVRYEGEGLPLADLRAAADFKTGNVANFAEIEAGLDRIKKRLRRQGYMQPETRVERKILDEKKTVDLVVHVEKGPQYVFGNLKIEGLDIHGEAAIRRMWTMKPGSPFNADYPDYFLSAVREEGIFDNLGRTKTAVDVNDKARTVDVTLSFFR